MPRAHCTNNSHFRNTEDHSFFLSARRQSWRVQGHESVPAQRVHVGIWFKLRAQRGSNIPTLRPKYVLQSYMDPLGCYPHEDSQAQASRQGVRGVVQLKLMCHSDMSYSLNSLKGII